MPEEVDPSGAAAPLFIARSVRRNPRTDTTEDFIEHQSRRVARHNIFKKIGLWVPYTEVHHDTRSQDMYQSCWLHGLEGRKDWDPEREGGMSEQGLILFRIYHHGNDTSWWDAPVHIPKNVLYPFAVNARLDDDPVARRMAWVAMGRDGAEWDAINGWTHAVQLEHALMSTTTKTLGSGEERESNLEPQAQGSQVVDPEFEAALTIFEQQVLTDLELRIMKYHNQGYKNPEIDDLTPHDMLGKTANAKTRAETVSRIYRQAIDKRDTYFDEWTERP